MHKSKRIIGLIPARLGSSRLPQKPLLPLAGKPLILHTLENAKRSKTLDDVYVVTDSEEIFRLVEDYGAQAIMTSSTCPTGTDRIIEATLKDPHLQSADYIVNIQGDEPALDPEVISVLVEKLSSDSEAVLSTAVTPISDKDALDPSCVKCVFSQTGRALYFSRQPIPYKKHDAISYYGHLGVYCYRTAFLTKIWNQLPPSSLQQSEDLEQLRVLEAGYPIAVCKVAKQAHGVDTLEDLKRMEQHLCKENIYS